MSNNSLQTNSKKCAELQVSKNLPALLAKQKGLMPVHKAVAVQRERGELLLIRERLVKQFQYLSQLLSELNNGFIPATMELEALNLHYRLTVELELVTAQGMAIKAELDALPQMSVPFKERPIADAELTVAELLSEFRGMLGLDSEKDKLGKLAASAALIVSEFGWLTEEGLASIFKRALTGEYTIYGVLNLPTLCKWIRDYKDEIDTAHIRLSETLHVQGQGEGNRGWEEREARKIANSRMAKKERAREEALHKVEVQQYVKHLRVANTE